MTGERWPGFTGFEQMAMEWELKREQLEKVVRNLIEEIEREEIDDTGRLIESIKMDIENGTVTMTAPYATYVEHGRGPSERAPPYAKIRRWVGHKLGIIERKRARRVTYAIMNKIRKEGIPAKHILEKAWERALEAE